MPASENKLIIVQQTLVENCFKAVLYNNGIVEIFWDKAVEIVEVEHLIQRNEVLLNFGGGKKMPLYMNLHDSLNYSKEAQSFAATEESGKYVLAIAVLLNSVSKKLKYNFFMIIFKPKTPANGFTTREDAFAWLEKLREEYEMKQL